MLPSYSNLSTKKQMNAATFKSTTGIPTAQTKILYTGYYTLHLLTSAHNNNQTPFYKHMPATFSHQSYLRHEGTLEYYQYYDPQLFVNACDNCELSAIINSDRISNCSVIPTAMHHSKASSAQDLVAYLQTVHSSLNKSKALTERPTEIQLKASMSRNYRPEWKKMGMVHAQSALDRLPARDLDNWQLQRINMSQRSYQYPKKYRGMKIPSVGKIFSEFKGRSKDNRIPYLYESDLPKISRLKEKLRANQAKGPYTAKRQYFGFPNASKVFGYSTTLPKQPKLF